MRKTTVSLAVTLGILLSHGIQTQAAILVTSVDTTGYASALSGIGYQNWDEEDFGEYSAHAQAYSSNDPGGTHTANSAANLGLDELNLTFQISGSASAYSPTAINYTTSNSIIEIHFEIDKAYSFSLTGYQNDLSVQLTRLPDIAPYGRYLIGDSGSLVPSNYKLTGFTSAYANGEGTSESKSYSAILTLAAAPIAGDFDEDGDGDGADFLVWQRNPGVGDLSEWQSNYGNPLSLAASNTAVPEPNSLLLLLLAVALPAKRGLYSHR